MGPHTPLNSVHSYYCSQLQHSKSCLPHCFQVGLCEQEYGRSKRMSLLILGYKGQWLHFGSFSLPLLYIHTHTSPALGKSSVPCLNSLKERSTGPGPAGLHIAIEELRSNNSHVSELRSRLINPSWALTWLQPQPNALQHPLERLSQIQCLNSKISCYILEQLYYSSTDN